MGQRAAAGPVRPSSSSTSRAASRTPPTRPVRSHGRGRGHARDSSTSPAGAASPVIFTTIAFEPAPRTAAVGAEVPHARQLQIGDRTEEIDPRLGLRPDEIVIRKKGSSAFFGTNLAAILVTQRVDTVVLCGATTSGCIRATAIDLMQHGFPALVPRECVGDRASGRRGKPVRYPGKVRGRGARGGRARRISPPPAASRNGDET